jgi:large subunit ribosomal protein L2
MGIKKVKPTTPGRRQATFADFKDITKSKPEKSLITIKKKFSGRNSSGKITIRHRGGGSKRYIRLVDFKRDKFDVSAKISAIEYDPNRGARLALLVYADGEKKYIIAPVKNSVGDVIISSQKNVDIKPGNAMPIKYIPAGVPVNNIELVPGEGAKMARGAGNGCGR